MRKLASFVILAVSCCMAAQSVAAQNDADSALESEIFHLVNRERARVDLPTLKWDDHLAQAARLHAQAMAAARNLSHQLPSEPDLGARLAAAGVRFNATAENVASSPWAEGAEGAHRGLMSSPPHRANILSTQYNALGVGAARSGNELYVTEDFAHAFPAVSPAEAKASVIAAINRERTSHARSPLRTVNLDKLRRLACREDMDVAKLLSQISSARSAAIFTTWDAQQLPPQVREAARSDWEAFAVEACAMEAQKGGAGGFRVSVVFF